ncbi:tetratricopeptide repeat protein [Maribacter stanieri]|uniref:tetratricopeptide repeat protein n=1 Tax=Maribacter stanieri TaxID=440514 RepID=UPI0024955291|nr:hypothetical protein [Maribacter stanieri]
MILKPVTHRALLIITFLLISVQVFSHGDLTKRINQKTKEIAKSPDDYKLYYERGFLYQQHVELNNAMKDYLKSTSLGNTDKVLMYRIAEVNYLSEDYKNALTNITKYLEVDSVDVKAKKLEAQILFKLEAYKESIAAYHFVMNTMVDIRPEDILEYTSIILTENNKNFSKSIDIIDFGLTKVGENTFSLQLKKLDYLKDSGQVEKTIKQYNYFILEYQRKEFWYFQKAAYLVSINKPKDANISLKLATATIEKLDAKFKNMDSILELKKEIKSLESTINN